MITPKIVVQNEGSVWCGKEGSLWAEIPATAGVIVYPVPHADFSYSPQPTTILDPHIQFTDASNGATINSWNWSLGENAFSSMQNPSHIYGDTGTYAVQLLVTSSFGCKDSVIKFVRIDPEYMIYVPNAFTPNFDQSNDVFMAKGEGIKDFQLYIFDRWGNEIFYSNDINKGWDGRFQSKGSEIVQEDVYVWKIELKSVKGGKEQLSGVVSLIK